MGTSPLPFVLCSLPLKEAIPVKSRLRILYTLLGLGIIMVASGLILMFLR